MNVFHIVLFSIKRFLFTDVTSSYTLGKKKKLHVPDMFVICLRYVLDVSQISGFVSVFDRPGVAGAVLQTALLLINSFIN